MNLTKDIELIDGLPIAYIKSLNALAVADLHLGYEGIMAKQGVFLPKVNLKKIKREISKAADESGADRLIVDGDIKNEFAGVDVEEFNELYDFINFSKERGISLILIKGNHDNFVDRYKEPFKLSVARQQMRIGNYLFFHGELMPKTIGSASMLIMGHEHPAIGVYNNLNIKQKLRCFLYGRYAGRPLLVLPAMNYFASGTEINLVPEGALLSPVFQKADINRMHAIAVGFGETIDFGTIAELRRAASA